MIPCYILTSIKDADHEEHVHGQQDQEPPLLEATGAFRGPVAETPIRGKNIYEYPAPISLMNCILSLFIHMNKLVLITKQFQLHRKKVETAERIVDVARPQSSSFTNVKVKGACYS